MIRSGLFSLSTRYCYESVARPTSVVLSEKLISSFFTKPKRQTRDEGLVHKTYSDAFDESDFLEVGKQQALSTHPNLVKTPVGRKQLPHRATDQRLRPHPLSAPLLEGFGDFLFSRDPIFRRDPFFTNNDRHILWDFHMDKKHGTLLRSSPGYEIKERKGMYEISVNVPNGIVNASDMTVELEHDGRVIHVSGTSTSKSQKDGATSSSMLFDTRFTVRSNVDTDKITANFDKGVLTLKAPKLEPDRVEAAKYTIAITQNAHASSEEEMIQKSYSDAFDESDWAETGKIGHERGTH